MTTRSHRAYAATQRETSVSSAKPAELVALVYKRLLDHLHSGKIQMNEGWDSSDSLTKAIDLITTGLESCLDKEKGGEIAQNLAFIYDWASKEIIRARVRRDPAIIQGVINALVPLAEAWLEHAGQKDEFFASKYLQLAIEPEKSFPGNLHSPYSDGMQSILVGSA